MTRGDYTVQDVEAAKQASRDNSYRTCVLTMFIFLGLCIILLLVAWPWRNKQADESEGARLSRLSRLTTVPPRYQNTDEDIETEYVSSPDGKSKDHLPIKISTEPTTETTRVHTKQHFFTSPATEKPMLTTKISYVVKPVTRVTTTSTHPTSITEKPEELLPVPQPETKPTTSTSQPATESTTTSTSQPTTESTTTSTSQPTTESTTTSTSQPTTKSTIASTLQPTTKPTTASTLQPTTESTTASTLQPTTESTTTSTSQPETQSTSASEKGKIIVEVSQTETGPNTTLLPSTDALASSENSLYLIPVSRQEADPTTSTAEDKILTRTTQPQSESTTTSTAHTETQFTEVTQDDKTLTVASQPESTTPTSHLESQSTSATEGKTLSEASQPETESTTSTSQPERQSTSTSERLIAVAQPETEPTTVSTLQPETEPTTVSTSQPETEPTTVSTSQPETEPTTVSTSQPETESTTTAEEDKRLIGSELTTSSAQQEQQSSSATEKLFETSQAESQSTSATELTESSRSGFETTSTADLAMQSTSATEEDPKLTEAEVTPTPSSADSTTHTEAIVTSAVQNSSTSGSADKREYCIPYSTHSPDTSKTCMEFACTALTSRMLSMMNHSEDPCENFYGYACGGLQDNHKLLQDDPEQDVSTRLNEAVKAVSSGSPEVFKKFSQFYEQCVSFDADVKEDARLTLVREVLHGVGKFYNRSGWERSSRQLNLTSLLVRLFQLNSAPLFDVKLDVDVHNTSRFLLKLIPPTQESKFQYESESSARCRAQILSEDTAHPPKIDTKNLYFMKYLLCKRNYTAYLQEVELALTQLRVFPDIEAFNISQNIQSIKHCIEMNITSHLEMLPPAGELRQTLISKHYSEVSVRDLLQWYKLVDWTTLFSALVGQTITADTPVQLYFQEYFDTVFQRLNHDLKSDENRMVLHNSLLAMLTHALYTDFVKTQSPCAREEYCLRVASRLLEDVSSALYLSTFTSEQLSAMDLELTVLFDQLKAALIKRLQEEAWLDDQSRSSFINKLQKMSVFVDGGKAILGEPDLLSYNLSDEDFKSSDNYIQNAVSLVRRYRRSMYALYNMEPINAIWSQYLLPYDTNAISVYELNTVVVPYGLIDSPQSTSSLPDYVFRARVGNEVARQMLHHFDLIGISYGAAGRDPGFLSRKTRSRYDTNLENYEMDNGFERTWMDHNKQVFKYEIDARSQNERFSDNSALNLTFAVSKKSGDSEPRLPWLDLSHDKVYYLLLAQKLCSKGGMMDYVIPLYETEHLPPFLRVNKMMESSEHFAAVYGCAKGSNMHPETKCKPFPEAEQVDDGDDRFHPQ